MALVKGVELDEGTLEIDLKGKGWDEASFLGVAFAVADAKSFEAVYFRPFNFHRDQAVQYVAWPEHTWEHARIEVTRRRVAVWVDGAKEPCLAVDRLGSRRKGMVGLWVDSQEGSFRNLKILPAK